MLIDSDNDSNIPTTQISQLMNSMKINSETNKDFKSRSSSSSSSSIDSEKENDLLNGMFKNLEDNKEKAIFGIQPTNVSDEIDKMIKNNKSSSSSSSSSSGHGRHKSSSSSSSSSSSTDSDSKKGITTEINKIFDKNKKDGHNYSPKYNNQQPNQINDYGNIQDNDDEEIDEYENLTPSKKKLARMDMLRKLAELKNKGYLISNNYTINSDYYTMKEEYEYQMTIKGKDSFVKNTFCYGINIIKLIEFANKKYNPLGIDLDGWNINVESSKEEIIDAIGEIYEKYHKPGSGVMAPELRLLIILVSSAASTVIANSGAKMLASMFKNTPVIENKEDIIKNLNSQINQQNGYNQYGSTNSQTQQKQMPIFNKSDYENMRNIKDEGSAMANEDLKAVENELKSRNYTIPPPKIPDSLRNGQLSELPSQSTTPIRNYQNNQQSMNNQQSSNNVFNNLVQQHKMSKKSIF